MIFYSQWFLRVFTFGFADGITLFPFIILSSKDLHNLDQIILHERIHIKQQLELLIVGFYIWYVLEYLFRLYQYDWNHMKAYRNISFEREAYARDCEDSYLKERPLWAFLNYCSLAPN